MKKKTARLYFIDAMRAWAILMMLQGHFIDGLLDTAFRNPDSAVYNIWLYFRGITAPVFFTVSGFIFTYLLIRGDKTGWENPRVKKGIRRGLELLFIGYLLRINFLGILHGEIYDSFYLVDVLHCIGLSLIGISGIYLLTHRLKHYLFPIILFGIAAFLFLLEPIYATANFAHLPKFLANYLSDSNGSVFTIIPWFGYAAFGAFISIIFKRYSDFKHLYPTAIAGMTAIGLALIFFSSDTFLFLSQKFGDVLLVFAVFMIIRSMLKNATLLKIGQSTLSIYIIHFIILYGSFTGLGLYRFFNHSLSVPVTVFGALAFMLLCSYLALQYEAHKAFLKKGIKTFLELVWMKLEDLLVFSFDLAKNGLLKLLRLVGLLKN